MTLGLQEPCREDTWRLDYASLQPEHGVSVSGNLWLTLLTMYVPVMVTLRSVERGKESHVCNI